MQEFITKDAQGHVEINPHQGQLRALQSEARIIAVISGSQGGKTALGPVFLWQEMMARGAGDYLVCAPTSPVLDNSALPKFRSFFEETMQLGRFIGSPTPRFIVSEDGQRRLWGHVQNQQTMVRLAHASDPNRLEALTLKGAWLDEAAQQAFRRESWDNIYTRRLAVHQGRVLLTTTPYSIDGWVRDICDLAQTDAGKHIEVIRFDSTMNPAFPQEAFEEARRVLPPWKFDLMFRGIFSRPAGLIYDSFCDQHAPQGHLIARQSAAVAASWARYCGIDFGGINCAAVFFAAEQDETGRETGRYILYRTYHPGVQRDIADHAREILKGEPDNITAYGGSGSEGQWRSEFRKYGLAVEKPPVSKGAGEGIVEVGINRVYAAFREGQILICDDLKDYLSQLRSYSREVDASGNVTEKIADKAAQHYMDATRYIWCHLRGEDTPTVKRISGANRARFNFA